MKTKVIMLRKRLKQNKLAAKYFNKRAALTAEGSSDSRKAAKSMLVQHHGNRYPHPGEYYQPRLSVRA